MAIWQKLRVLAPVFRSIIFLFVVGATGVAASSSSRGNSTVYQLAQGCYAIQSPATGQYLSKSSTARETLYQFQAENSMDAVSFYFKPSGLGRFLLTDQDGDFLGSLIPQRPIAVSRAAPISEWDIQSKADDFIFKNVSSGVSMAYRYEIVRKWFWFSWKETKSETAFRLVPQNDCAAFPEIEVAAWPYDQPEAINDLDQMNRKLEGAVDKPVRAFIDAHSHIYSAEFLGGKAISGDPFHPYGVAHALANCSVDHGPTGELDIIGGSGKPHATEGWPKFTDWPAHDSQGHSGYYYKWIQRAHLAGQRMMVVYLVENQVLCEIQGKVNPVHWLNKANSCDTMASIYNQIDWLHRLVSYVDAQEGGPGRGFLQIATSPQQARELIAEGKLALVLGVEASEVLNCGEKDYCDVQKVDGELDALFDAGVRVMYPVHKFDNHFGGANTRNVADGLVHLGHKISTGHYIRTENCDEQTHHYDNDPIRGSLLPSGVPFLTELELGLFDFWIDGFGPQYPSAEEQCNSQGLTQLGDYLINRMIDKKMMIDLDHISPKAAASIMDIVESRQYSGVVSTHSWMLKGKSFSDVFDHNDRLHKTFLRLVEAGGFVSPMNRASEDLIPVMEEYLLARLQAQYPGLSQKQLLVRLEELDPDQVPGVGIGIDMAGLATMARPTGAGPDYPFITELGIVFDQQGDPKGRMFDIATDGLAHYGMLADHVELVRQQASKAKQGYVYHALMNSAEAYLQTWERAQR